MATDQLINKTQGDAIIAGLAAIKNAINDQPVPTQVEDVVSDAFDVGVSYVPGDYCICENKLYKCDVAHHGAWDGNDFTLTNVGAELDTLNNALNKLYYVRKNITSSGTEYGQVNINPNTTIILAAYDIATSNARKKIVCYAQPDNNTYGLYGIAGTMFTNNELIDFVCYDYT